MRAYMASGWDPHDGAVLVFANTAREAKKLAWDSLAREFVDEWTELRVKWLKEGAAWHLDPEKAAGPHVVESPEPCHQCELWYADGLSDEGLCDGCQDELEYEHELDAASPTPETTDG